MSVSLTHSDKFLLAVLAMVSIATNSSGDILALTIQLLASPFGSFGRPILEDFCLCGTKIDFDIIHFLWHSNATIKLWQTI
jgi:hypothetical protein